MTRVLKFAAVGATGTLVNIGILWLLTDVAGLFYIFSAAIGIEASIITNFIINEHWTFSDRRKEEVSMITRAAKFNLVSFVSMAANISILFALTQYFGIYYIISELFGIGAGFLINFSLNLRWTWK
jgi:dolichol-phosphate mannosyltransferase